MNKELHPITPPLELVRQWCSRDNVRESYDGRHIATQAARWGADQELQACCEWVEREIGRRQWGDELRAYRRPKPPSFKQQAQRILVENGTTLDGRMELEPEDIEILKAALELLPDEEV